MKSQVSIGVLLGCCLFGSHADAQSVKRPRPDDWKDLAFGGRFMDRFLPMPVQGKLTSDSWGADNVKPRYIDNGLEDSEWSYWGGNAIRGHDGRYHLFVCRWREDSPKGHMEWHNSIVVHAVADQSTGPYRVEETVGPGHNPEIYQLRDGRYVIYVIGGYYISNRLNGPWNRGKFEFDRRDRRIIEGLSNLTFTRREDGSFLMVCRGGGVWLSETGLGPWQQVTDRRIYPAVSGNFEDPVVWRTTVQYHLIVNDWRGRIAYYLRSKDGIRWKVEPGEAYEPGIAKYEDGTAVDWYKYERIKVLQDEHGRATQAHFAVIDVLKRNDKASDHHSSKHICIPLTIGRQLTILDDAPISHDTTTIGLKIAAEKGFDPHKDVDVASLRFGASEEVNFGRGCRAIKSERSGKDLVVTFNGIGNGITEDNFAAKLVGKTTDGKLLFGFSRLPGVDYLEPALSARLPIITPIEVGFHVAVEVQNFGQIASKPADLTVSYDAKDGKVEVTSGTIPALNPFQKSTVELNCGKLFEAGTAYDLEVLIDPGTRGQVGLHGNSVPLPAAERS